MLMERPHGFSAEEALARIQALTTYWTQYGVRAQWTGNTAFVDGKVKGVKFRGEIRVEAHSIVADIKAGFLAEKLGGKKYVERKINDYLDAANSLEELQARNKS